jgi:hypothetical protein
MTPRTRSSGIPLLLLSAQQARMPSLKGSCSWSPYKGNAKFVQEMIRAKSSTRLVALAAVLLVAGFVPVCVFLNMSGV